MKEFSKTPTGAIILAIISCLIWAVHNVVARGIHEWMNPVEINFWRWLVAFIVLIPFTIKNFRKNFALFKSNLRFFICVGFLTQVMYNVLFYTASHFTSANNISLLTTTSFLWTISLGAIFKIDTLSRKKLIGAAIAMMGVFIVVLKGNFENLIDFQLNKGDLILVIACFGWGVYSLLIKKKPKNMDQTFAFAAGIFCGLVFLLPLYILELYYIPHTPFTVEKITVILCFGTFVSVLAWSFYNNCVHVLGPVKTSTIYFLLPVMTSIAAYLILGEKLYLYHVAGFVLIVTGIFISNHGRKIK